VALAALVLALAMAAQASAAVYDVNSPDNTFDANTADSVCADASGKCTLRAAVQQANATPADDTIDVPADRYSLAGQGDLPVQAGGGSLTIAGAGARGTVITAAGFYRHVTVDSGASLALSGVTLSDGVPCYCQEDSGAVHVSNGARLYLTDARLTRNQTRANGGAIGNFGGYVELTRVRIDHNEATGDGAGVYQRNGELKVVDSLFEANSAQGSGGAIASRVEPVTSTAAVGEQQLAEVAQGKVTITGSTMSHNSAGVDGGAFNSSERGGSSPSISIENSTLSGNTAGAAKDGSGGGAINHESGTLTLRHDTLADNQVVVDTFPEDAARGGTIRTSRLVNLRETIVAGGSDEGEPRNCATSGDGSFVSQGNNLETGDTCNLDAAADKTDTDPKLGPLSDNGGQTPTHALVDGSPAIDAASQGEGPALDQRGGDRPPPATGSAGAVRDIGAYEAHSFADLSVDVKFDAPDPATVGQPLTWSLVVRNDGPDKVSGVTLSDTLPAGVELVSAAGCTGTVACALGTLGPNELRTITIVVRPTAAGTLSNTATVSAAGVADPVASNNSASSSTTVAATTPLPPPDGNSDVVPTDDGVDVTLTVPKTVTIDQFMDGIVVEADCKDEPCLRRFREHAAINTGAAHIAGFNLTVSRGFLSRSSTRTRIRLQPCQSGSKNGRRHKRCMRNLRKAAERAGKFRVKVVVSAVDAAGNKDYAKAYVKVGG
jgi:uncharacterized repeat protein (TIGR01451 family)